MGKRKRKLVPAALHSELTEYSSLIRALRASDSLDVTSHLSKACSNGDSKSDRNLSDTDTDDGDPQEANSQYETTGAEDEYDTDTIANACPPTSSPAPSRDVSPSQESRSSSPVEGSPNSPIRKRKRYLSPAPHQRRRDAWTRWPLLVDDIHVPEWTFGDEVGYLAEHFLKHQSRPLFPPPEEAKDNEDHDVLETEESDDVNPPYIPYLAQAASNYLSTILALLVAHTPNRPDSQQNRVEPMGWRAVLDVLSSSGDPNVADPKMLSSVKMRLESLYSPSESSESTEDASDALEMHRMRYSFDAKQKLKDKLESSLDSVLDFPEIPEGWAPPRPKRRSLRKVRKTSVKTPAYVEDEAS